MPNKVQQSVLLTIWHYIENAEDLCDWETALFYTEHNMERNMQNECNTTTESSITDWFITEALPYYSYRCGQCDLALKLLKKGPVVQQRESLACLFVNCLIELEYYEEALNFLSSYFSDDSRAFDNGELASSDVFASNTTTKNLGNNVATAPSNVKINTNNQLRPTFSIPEEQVFDELVKQCTAFREISSPYRSKTSSFPRLGYLKFLVFQAALCSVYVPGDIHKNITADEYGNNWSKVCEICEPLLYVCKNSNKNTVQETGMTVKDDCMNVHQHRIALGSVFWCAVALAADDSGCDVITIVEQMYLSGLSHKIRKHVAQGFLELYFDCRQPMIKDTVKEWSLTWWVHLALKTVSLKNHECPTFILCPSRRRRLTGQKQKEEMQLLAVGNPTCFPVVLAVLETCTLFRNLDENGALLKLLFPFLSVPVLTTKKSTRTARSMLLSMRYWALALLSFEQEPSAQNNLVQALSHWPSLFLPWLLFIQNYQTGKQLQLVHPSYHPPVHVLLFKAYQASLAICRLSENNPFAIKQRKRIMDEAGAQNLGLL